MNIVCDQNLVGIDPMLAGLGRVTKYGGRDISRAVLADADALLVRSITPVNEALLAGTPVKFVGTATAGFDHFDHPWLDEAGIHWASAPGCNANSVVEYVLSAILAVDDFWERLAAGGQLGIIGFGHVGRLLLTRARALGVSCRVYDPWLPDSVLVNASSLEQVLASDVICVHASLTHEAPWPSFHLLDEASLEAVPSDSLLINASRGPVAKDAAMLARLSGADAPAAVLDVWESEPLINPELLAVARIGTPHIAGHSYDAKLNGARQIVTAMRNVFKMTMPNQSVGAEAKPLVEVPPGLEKIDALRHVLGQTYRIEEDDLALRDALGAASREHYPAVFDRLRTDYPVRRELAGSRLAGAVGDAATFWLAAAFDCDLEVME